ncbi:MAG: GGDEF domain-containing protein, partial [Alphaproteobacteria bacterium]
ALTGIANRKYFDIRLMECMEQAQESTKPLSLLIMDIDHFKMFNDRHGHLLGDQVLRLVARTITESVKGRDTAARYGGEEFVVLLPETRLSNGMTVAQQIRRAVAGKKVVRKVTGQELGTVTLSVGVAELKAGELPEEFIRRADSAMYEAKGNGRNRVVAEDSGLMVHAASG